MCKQYSVQKKGKQTSSAQFNTEFRKTQDPLNIVLNCRVLYLQGYAKKSFFSKLAKRCMKKKKWTTINIEMSKNFK